MPSSLLDAPVGGPRHHNLGRVREPLAGEQRNLGLWIKGCFRPDTNVRRICPAGSGARRLLAST